MATASRKKFGILIGSGVLAGAAVVFFGFIWPPSGGTEGAIGQRQVYREGGVKASDVSVTPGTAPTVIKSFLQGKQFHEAARKDGFPEVDSKEFTALTENSEFLAFLATPGLATFLGNPLFPKVVQTLQARPKGTKWTLQLLNDGLGPDAVKSPAYNDLIRNHSFQRFMDNPAAPEVLSNPVFQKLMAHPPLTRMVAIVQPNSLFLNPSNNESAMSNVVGSALSNGVNSAMINSNSVNSATVGVSAASNGVNSATVGVSAASNGVNSATVGVAAASNGVNSATVGVSAGSNGVNTNTFSNSVSSAGIHSNGVSSNGVNSAISSNGVQSQGGKNE